MNIVIVTSGHKPLDERIFYKLGLSLKKYEHDVAIICSTENIETVIDGINIKGFEGNALTKKDKIKRLFNALASFSPSLIICCEPLTILAAYKYKKWKSKGVKIISDITEYYPHQNMLNKYSGIVRIIQYLRLSFFNAYVSNLADYLFIGEENKAKKYNIIAPTRKKSIIGYYPPQKFFKYLPPCYDGKHFTLCYAGSMTEASGFVRYLNLVKIAAERFTDKIFIAKIIGPKQNNFADIIGVISTIKNIRVVHHDWVSYPDFSSEFNDVDLCVDLRDKNYVFNRSLPIKVFDYLACGKPFIFSNLASFKGFKDVKNAGLLVEPDDLESALQRISLYLNNAERLKEDSLAANRLFKDKYNWEAIEIKIVEVINSLFKNR
jgi:glycosyltransferase involved in cell wall biosynthesis